MAFQEVPRKSRGQGPVEGEGLRRGGLLAEDRRRGPAERGHVRIRQKSLGSVFGGNVFWLTAGVCLLIVELLGLQFVQALIRRTFPV